MEDPNTQAPQDEDTRQPLWKQLLGAVIGGGLALALYYGYEYTKPKVAAYLTLPPAERMYDLGASNIADKTTDEGNRKRLLSRNVRIAQGMQESALKNDPNALDTVDDHSLDITWPGHNPDDPKYTEVTGIEPEPEAVAMEDAMPEETTMDVNILEEQMATKEMGGDDWENLWGDIRSRDEESDHTVESNAQALPESGFGLGFIAAGATGGALASRKRRRKMA